MVHLFAEVLEIKVKMDSGKFSIVIGFFGDVQHKSQYFLVLTER